MYSAFKIRIGGLLISNDNDNNDSNVEFRGIWAVVPIGLMNIYASAIYH